MSSEATGNCYQIVRDVAIRVAHLATEVRIVHGIAVGRGPIEGVRFGHAWIECVVNDGDDVVVDVSNGIKPRFIDRGQYYLLGKINSRECIKYTIAEHLALALKHENWGPWTEAHMEVM